MGKYFNGDSPGIQRLTNAICEKAKGVFDAMQPCDIRYGIVKTLHPLQIEIPGIYTVDEDELAILDTVSLLAIGDYVAMIRAQGGQQFLLLGKTRHLNPTPAGFADFL